MSPFEKPRRATKEEEEAAAARSRGRRLPNPLVSSTAEILRRGDLAIISVTDEPDKNVLRMRMSIFHSLARLGLRPTSNILRDDKGEATAIVFGPQKKAKKIEKG